MADDEKDDEYHKKVKFVNAVAKPLASAKTTKKLHKLVKKASSGSNKHIKRGVKEVVKAIRKGIKGDAFCIYPYYVKIMKYLIIMYHLNTI